MRARAVQRREFSRRAFLLGAAAMGGFSALAARLYWLQFAQGSEYRDLSEGNRVRLQPILPPRGLILDRNGLILVDNQPNYRLVMDPMQRDAPELFPHIAALLGRPDAVERWRKEWDKRLRSEPFQLAEHLEWQELVKIEYALPRLPGASIDTGEIRSYPLAALGAHLFGYVGLISPKEKETLPPALGRLPRLKIGKSGIEKGFDENLRGEPGVSHREVNARGQGLRELERDPPIPGAVMNTTIDRRLQEFAAKRLGEESGSVILLDARSGGLLALASMPAFDPNRFSEGITTKYWNELREHERVPLMNKALAGQYPPGSTFKMVTGLAGLRSGVVTPESRVHCPGYFYLGNHRFRCWKERGHGSVDLHHAIAESCDTYFYHVGHRAGIDAIAEAGRLLGFGQKSGLPLTDERVPPMPTPEWKRERFGQPWTPGDTVNVSIGQGYMLATPMQLAIMTLRLVTGRAMSPHIVPPVNAVEAPLLAIDPAHLQVTLEGMSAVINEPYGTAASQRFNVEEHPEWQMGGKTGTAQVRRITIQGQDQSRLPWKHRHHALFVGYAPVENPRYACAVVVEHGGGGGTAAAPVARDVLLEALRLEMLDDPHSHEALVEPTA